MAFKLVMNVSHSKVFRSIHIVYRFKGQDLAREKLSKAVELSMERYCGVTAMLKQVETLLSEGLQSSLDAGKGSPKLAVWALDLVGLFLQQSAAAGTIEPIALRVHR